ncbi:hypothetical protein CBF34_00335 [Vagococcus penaei]|uniref:Uncharacterized protein n=1 Tax=Vagococcus penaei TaxID=633807 RepID=A0A1Q2D577_9ENTE|nr:YueI family protein [Vagococcus penaei]AQP53548.1 hypothetical protein BW732_04415 [Vagococcus penaei]RSU07491.1 hypothetical protein CBF34_00335 [Vagococcus penaei]
MANKDVQDYLDKGLFGAPQLRPDEQKLFLGTFRERVVLALTIQEMESLKYDNLIIERLNTFDRGHFLINANVSLPAQDHYMKLAQTYEKNFRLVDTDHDKGKEETIGLVYAVDTPVDLDDIFVPNNFLAQREQEKRHHKLEDKLKKLF